MTTGFSQVTALDAAALDSLIGQAVRGRSATLTATASGTATATAAAPEVSAAVALAPAPAEDDGRSDPAAPVMARARLDSMPDAAAFARQLGRSFRTAAPLLAADVAALALAGTLAEAVLRLVLPHHAPVLGAAAPLALLPLIVGYWLGGLYSEVWLHPALEMRQSTHAATV